MKKQAIRKQVIGRILILSTAAFGLITALAWNEAIKSLFAEGGLLEFAAMGGVWIYAVLVTVVAVIATIWISKISDRIK